MLAGTCAFCSNSTHFTAQAGRLFNRRVSTAGGRTKYEYDVDVAATCDACHRFNVATGTSASLPNDHGDRVIVTGSSAVTIGEQMTISSWSPPPMLPAATDFVPDGVAGYLQEAHDAFSIGAHRAVLLLVRSVIEATARDKGIESGSLVQKINKLHDEGHIRSGTREMAHVLRILGNDMAHGEIEAVPSLEDADDALTVMRFVLDDVYVADARRIDMLDRRR